jgi:hypothetical protein
MFGKCTDVRSRERFAAREEYHWYFERGQVVNDREGLLCRKNLLPACGGGIAVRTCEVACRRHVPYHDWSLMHTLAVA